jgi:hypothetical protein
MLPASAPGAHPTLGGSDGGAGRAPHAVWAASSNRRPRTARRLGWHGWVTRGGETTEVEREYSWICGGGGRLIFFVRDAGADTVLFAPFFSGCGT